MHLIILTSKPVTCTRSTQDDPSEQSVMNERGTYEDLPLPVEILSMKDSE